MESCEKLSKAERRRKKERMFAVSPSTFRKNRMTIKLDNPFFNPENSNSANNSSSSLTSTNNNIENNLMKAVKDNIANDEKELSFKCGDMIVVTDIDNTGWAYGSCNDASGWFPLSSIQFQLNSNTNTLKIPAINNSSEGSGLLTQSSAGETAGDSQSPPPIVYNTSILSSREQTEKKLNNFFSVNTATSRADVQSLRNKNILHAHPSESSNVVKAKQSLDKSSKMRVLSNFLKSVVNDPAKPSRKLFGEDWRTIVKRPENANYQIPYFVIQCTDFLLKPENIIQEGLFRKSASSSQLDDLKKSFEQGAEAIHDIDNKDIDLIAAALKAYFRDLPEPLFPSRFYTEFMDMPNIPNVKQRIEAISAISQKLDPDTVVFANHVLSFLKEVSYSKEQNKMDTQNLSVVFGPNLIRPAKNSSTIETITDIPKVIQVTHYFIQWGAVLPSEEELAQLS